MEMLTEVPLKQVLIYVHANESHPNNVAKYWYECGHCEVILLFNFVWERS